MTRRIYATILAAAVCVSAGCSDYVDINTNPNAPQTVTANLYLPPMLHWVVGAAKAAGAHVLAVANVLGSAIPRMADAALYTPAGPEIDQERPAGEAARRRV